MAIQTQRYNYPMRVYVFTRPWMEYQSYNRVDDMDAIITSSVQEKIITVFETQDY